MKKAIHVNIQSKTSTRIRQGLAIIQFRSINLQHFTKTGSSPGSNAPNTNTLHAEPTYH